MRGEAGAVNVLHLTDGLTRGGGIEVTLGQALDRLAKTRFRVQVAVLERKSDDLGDALLARGVAVNDLGARAFASFAVPRKLARLVRRERIALIHANNPACILLALRVKRRFPDVKVVGHIRGLLTLGTEGDPRRSRVRRARKRLTALRCAIRSLDRVLCVSTAVLCSVERETGATEPHAVVVHNGRDLAPYRRFRDGARRAELRARLPIAPEGPLVTIVARLGSEKDFDTFLRAAARVRERIGDARFLIVGEGRRRPRIEAAIGSLGLGDAVTLAGFRSDVPEIMGATDVFCLTSVSESFANVLVEAMAAGVPCVSTDCGGPADIVDDGEDGFLVPVGDDAAVARATLAILEDPALRARMSAAAAAKSERFGIDAMVAGWVRVYEQALAGGVPAAGTVL